MQYDINYALFYCCCFFLFLLFWLIHSGLILCVCVAALALCTLARINGGISRCQTDGPRVKQQLIRLQQWSRMASNKMLFPPLNAELNSGKFHLGPKESVASVQHAQLKIETWLEASFCRWCWNMIFIIGWLYLSSLHPPNVHFKEKVSLSLSYV